MNTINLYAKFENDQVVELKMPAADGAVGEAPCGAGWYAVSWPVNPHDTGERMIKRFLSDGFPHRRPVGVQS